MSVGLDVVAFGYLVTMGMAVDILLEEVTTTVPFFLEGKEQLLDLSCELLVSGCEGSVGVRNLGGFCD